MYLYEEVFASSLIPFGDCWKLNMQKTTVETLHATNLADAERWSRLVSDAPTPDAYYLPAYAEATSEIEHSEPVAIIAGPESRLLAPLLVRRMSAVVNGTRIDWADACSPYGYGGLLNLSGSEHINSESLQCFFEDLLCWCSSQNIVCCVLRMHPMIRQEEWFAPKAQWQRFLRIQMRGTTTAIDLADWVDTTDRPRGMRKDRRSDLNRAQRTLRVTWALGDDRDVALSIDRFSTIYNLALDRHRADDFHRFPPSYFSRLTALRDRLGIAFAWLDEELVGANIFLAGWNYAHGHLAGVNEAGLKYGAGTLLIVEGAKWARKRGCKLLHLGGGLTPGDSLENFKCSFGGHSYRYFYLTFIADRKKFDSLRELPNAPWPYRMNE